MNWKILSWWMLYKIVIGGLAKAPQDVMPVVFICALIDRNYSDPDRSREVSLGCANRAGEDNRYVARMVSLLTAEYPVQPRQ